jgi:type II secretory pathway component PulF
LETKIVSMAAHLAAKQPSHAEDAETKALAFLLDEGLDLLASYRAIADQETRARLRDLAERLARGEAVDLR